ncbi:hypothetical protein EJ05DRAFT_530647 [Pseudovirgaria hyperparasitica]|uniref:Lethal giant larvae (Lgl)-like C-terminal domain-containing protein n=1 Tax=Pseudovirgaria hyperparasitica TaxID=470096 RepID=A0A6A6WDR5_9PEZI|nr:uncharacterized protein EJ05DRAFT_530647 [Pseudovirgaria hyperparasitica]KAF2760853.1 hypothetical protein EJ05DRAFT_530647 [Pseudovirgaria hyperparasitica]
MLDMKMKASVRILQFCADKLICLNSNNHLTIFSLDTKKILVSYTPPATVTTMHSDPTLDYVLLGTTSGEIFAYDLDREAMAPFKLPNYWRQQNPQVRSAPIISLQLHPRDVGSLLIGYTEGAVLYSFKLNQASKFFHYEIPRGAPGGDSDPGTMNRLRWPKLTQALWHPTGTFILTGHEDGSLVFWDPKDGRIVMARTLTDTNVNQPGAGIVSMGNTPGTFAAKEPIFKIAWCANTDPDDTCILISGGASTTLATKGLTLFELGRTPNYATSSWQILSGHLADPKRQRILPSPPNAEVVDFCLIPRTSPHFAGAHDPIAVLAILSSGEIITLSFPSGIPINPTNHLHPSMTFVHPYISNFSLSPMDRTRWLGLTERRQHGPPILRGGFEERHVPKRFENRNVIQTAHVDGTIRMWDVGHGDEIENDTLLQADVGRALGRLDGVKVSKISLSGASAELATGLESGEVVVFRWATNRSPGVEPRTNRKNAIRELTDITDRKDPALSEGFHPYTLLDEQNGPVSALNMSDVGFLAAGFQGGSLSVIDMRGPAIIYNTSVTEFIKDNKGGSFKRRSQDKNPSSAYPTAIEFSVMTAEGDDYSSILMHVGTSNGHVATFKILPGSGGIYTVKYAGSVSVDDRIITIHPINSGTGNAAFATQNAVAGLRTGFKTSGVIVAVSQTGARVFKPATNKGAHKTWDEFFCDSATVVRYQDAGYALMGLYGDGYARVYSLPALKEIAAVRIDHIFDIRRFQDAIITATADILGWTGPSEMALVNLWGAGLDLNKARDGLFNPELMFPPRPTISNFQWMSGTQYVTPLDLDLLIGGPDRPPSKKMIMQARAEDRERMQAERALKRPAAATASSDEGYWAYMQRQLNERAERLNIVGDSMDQLGNASQGWADDVGKFVQKQKRNMIMGAVKGKFGL